MAPIKAQQDETGAMPQEVKHENREGTAQLAGSPGAFALASAFGPRIPLSPPDDGGSGGGGDGGSGGENTGGDGGQGGAGGDGGEGGAQPPVRPDYLPENLWDPEKGFKSDDFNALVARDAERTAELAQVPDAADKYEIRLPHGFEFPEGFELKDGESPINPDDPRVVAARDFAHANKLSQAQFEGMVAMGFNLDVAENKALAEAQEKQAEALGTKGKERVGAVKSWVSAKLPADQAEALLGVLFTKTQIEAMEGLMRLNRGGIPGDPGAGRQVGKQEISDEEYNKMSPTERINYARQHSKT